MNIKKFYNALWKSIKNIAWYCTTRKCPQCHGSGRVMGMTNPPSWTIHGKFLKLKNICGICHSFGRVPLIQKKKKIDFSDYKTIRLKTEKSRRMPWIPERRKR